MLKSDKSGAQTRESLKSNGPSGPQKQESTGSELNITKKS